MIQMVKGFNKHLKALKYIASHLSEDNTAELHALAPDADAAKVLVDVALESSTGFFCYDKEGNPRGVGGVLPTHNIWFVVTQELTKTEAVPWLKRAREITTELLKKHRPLWGHCYEKNEMSMTWMRWCGFDFAPLDSHANYEINGQRFIYFQKN